MINSLTVDVAALQQLPESEPVMPLFVEGGLCGGLVAVTNVAANVIGCVGLLALLSPTTQAQVGTSAPPEE